MIGTNSRDYEKPSVREGRERGRGPTSSISCSIIPRVLTIIRRPLARFWHPIPSTCTKVPATRSAQPRTLRAGAFHVVSVSRISERASQREGGTPARVAKKEEGRERAGEVPKRVREVKVMLCAVIDWLGGAEGGGRAYLVDRADVGIQLTPRERDMVLLHTASALLLIPIETQLTRTPAQPVPLLHPSQTAAALFNPSTISPNPFHASSNPTGSISRTGWLVGKGGSVLGAKIARRAGEGGRGRGVESDGIQARRRE